MTDPPKPSTLDMERAAALLDACEAYVTDDRTSVRAAAVRTVATTLAELRAEPAPDVGLELEVLRAVALRAHEALFRLMLDEEEAEHNGPILDALSDALEEWARLGKPTRPTPTAEATGATRTRCTGCGHFGNELTYDLGRCSVYGDDGHHMIEVDERGFANPRRVLKNDPPVGPAEVAWANLQNAAEAHTKWYDGPGTAAEHAASLRAAAVAYARAVAPAEATGTTDGEPRPGRIHRVSYGTPGLRPMEVEERAGAVTIPTGTEL